MCPRAARCWQLGSAPGAGVCSWGWASYGQGWKRLAFPVGQRSPEEQSSSCTFEVFLSDHPTCRHWNGFRSLMQTLTRPQHFAAAPRESFAPRSTFLLAAWGCWSPAVMGEEVVHHHCQKGWWFASSTWDFLLGPLPPSAGADSSSTCAAVLRELRGYKLRHGHRGLLTEGWSHPALLCQQHPGLYCSI